MHLPLLVCVWNGVCLEWCVFGMVCVKNETYHWSCEQQVFSLLWDLVVLIQNDSILQKGTRPCKMMTHRTDSRWTQMKLIQRVVSAS